MAFAVVVAALLLGAAQCGGQPAASTGQATGAAVAELESAALAPGERLKVVATTSIVADVVHNVGGDLIDLSVLLPLGTDPHTFEPTPRDLARVADAHLVFANGFGLEGFLNKLIANAGGPAAVVSVSDGVEARELVEHEDDEPGEENPTGIDPHTWTSPANVVVFVRNIERALSARNPANAETYRANAAAYTAQLEELDAWVMAQIASIPAENRELVTDHDAFGYYADRYGLRFVGAVIPGFSTTSEPSAKELSRLEDAVRTQGVKAVFVGTTANPILSQRVAEDTGIEVVTLYVGSLGVAGSGVETYLDYVRYNTAAIVAALK